MRNYPELTDRPMRSYLDLIPMSARVHKKGNRMTLLCIFLSVFLVTAIFGMADMEVRSQRIRMLKEYGHWHIRLSGISEEDAALVALRPDVQDVVWYDCLNYRLDRNYRIGDRETVICGYGGNVMGVMEEAMEFQEGVYPAQSGQVALTENARELSGLTVGDEVTLQTPSGTLRCIVSGFTRNNGRIAREDAVGAFLTREDFESILPAKKADAGVWYVRLAERGNLRHAIDEIGSLVETAGGRMAENTGLLGVMGMSLDPSMLGIMASACFLFLLVLTAGVLMITGSMNSNVEQRTAFFGLLRCLGASGGQIMRFVRREALGWCRQAIPAGLLLGTLVTWGLCALLSLISPTWFGDMPIRAVSPMSWIFGTVVGILTVLISARTPAGRAAGVSPLAAVSGNAEGESGMVRAAGGGLLRVDTALGISHALTGGGGLHVPRGPKRALRHAGVNRRTGKVCDGKNRMGWNLILMSGSFALCIVLFLSFSVLIQFMNHAVNPLAPYTPDLSLISPGNDCSIDAGMADMLEELPGVKRAYGRAFAYDLAAEGEGGSLRINLISYEAYQFAWAQDYLLEGSLERLTQEEEAASGGVRYALAVYDPDSALHVGDRIWIEGKGGRQEAEIAGLLSKSPFQKTAGTEDLICSEAFFTSVTGEKGQTVVDIQLTQAASEEDVAYIRSLAEGMEFSDRRQENAEVKGAYWSFALFVYGFLVIIALITVLNISNNIAMSVSARIRQYGAMRAIGMSCRQLEKMVLAEALTQAVSGSLLGGILGLPVHRQLFARLISIRWGDAWRLPWSALATAWILVLVSAVIAVYGPVRRLRRMTIVENISAQ